MRRTGTRILAVVITLSLYFGTGTIFAQEPELITEVSENDTAMAEISESDLVSEILPGDAEDDIIIEETAEEELTQETAVPEEPTEIPAETVSEETTEVVSEEITEVVNEELPEILPEEIPEETSEVVPEEELTPLHAYSGICGESAVWELESSSGTLIISGSGAMADYGELPSEQAPWYEYADTILNVVISEGITRIGSCAFSGMYAITRICIPSTLQTVGLYAFGGCSSLVLAEYGGTGSGWEAIPIGSSNALLAAAVIHTADHAFTQITEPEVAATCTEPGHTQSSRCSVCSEVIGEPQQEIPMIPHSLNYVQAVAATHTGDGVRAHYECSMCHGLFEDKQGAVPVTEEELVVPRLGAGWQKTGGKWYYYNEEGIMQTGWQKLDGKWYYFAADGVMLSGWQKIDNKWYYFTAGGVMQSGWQKIDNKWYYFAAGGAMQTGWQKIDNKWYYFAAGGAMLSGWQKIDNKWYYFAAGGAILSGWQKIDSKWFYFAAGGAMQTGWQKIDGKMYYFTAGGVMQSGWQKLGGRWYYLQSGGAMATGWQQISGNWYYLGEDGMMRTGSQQIGDEWYYFASSGIRQTGWQQISGKWHYFETNGVMTTRWRLIGGAYYYFGKDGVMRTGWQKVNKNWYYFSKGGMMRTGWQKIGGSLYYMNKDGVMQTGWLEADGKSYYLEADGKAVTGGKIIDDTFCIFANDGQQLTLTYIGDSLGVYVRNTLYSEFEDIVINTVVGRSFDITQTNISSGMDAAAGLLYRIEGNCLIYELGTNDGGTTYEEMEEKVKALRELVGYDTYILFMTSYIYQDGEELTESVYGDANQALRDIAAADDRLVCADWAKTAVPDYIEDPHINGVHLTEEGVAAFVELIKETLLNGFAAQKDLPPGR